MPIVSQYGIKVNEKCLTSLKQWKVTYNVISHSHDPETFNQSLTLQYTLLYRTFLSVQG